MTEKRAVHNLIAGKAQPATDGRTSDLVDPSTGEVFATAVGLRIITHGSGHRRHRSAGTDVERLGHRVTTVELDVEANARIVVSEHEAMAAQSL